MGGIFVGWLLLAAILVHPVWRIYRRAGLNPGLALFLFLPAIGPLVVTFIIGFARWPAARDTRAPGQ